MTETILSKHQILIRLTDERWQHIVTQHTELAEFRQQIIETITDPERILAGSEGELLAVREIEIGKWLVVVYRELDEDGFVITAFLTRRKNSLDRRTVIWSP